MQDSKLAQISSFLENRKAQNLLRQDQDIQTVLQTKLKDLLKQEQELSSTRVEGLRKQAQGFDNLANFAEKLADQQEKQGKSQKASRVDDKVKEVLMEALGVPAEFIDQLGLLAKAGPEALREAAELYRKEAATKRQEADTLVQERTTISKKISSIREALNCKAPNKQDANINLQERISKSKDLAELWRDFAELEYKKMLEESGT